MVSLVVQGSKAGPRHQLLFVFAPLGLATGLLRRESDEKSWCSRRIITSGLIVCLIFWFWAAPDLRFGRGIILALSLLGASVVFSLLPNRPQFTRFLPTLVMAGMVIASLRGLHRQESDYFYKAPNVSTYTIKGLGGKRLYVPKAGDQCWDHELPCAPYIGVFELERIKWPANWPVPPPGWTPDDPLQIGKKGGLPD